MIRPIAILITNLSAGGAEQLLVNTIPEYVREGVPIKLFILNRNSKKEYLDKLTPRLEVEILSNLSIYNPLVLFKLRKVFRASRIIHVHLFPLNFWLVLSRFLFSKGHVLINTEHGIVNKEASKKSHVKLLLKFIYKNFDYHIAISKSIATKIEQLIGDKAGIVQINNGVDVQRILASASIAKKHICAEINIPDTSKLLCMTARFREPKNQEMIVKSLVQINENVHAVFIGEGDQMEHVIDVAAQLGLANRVHFLGFKSNAISYMKGVDINILSSHYEGLSGVVVEGLASGKPFLGSDVSGINDVLADARYLFSDGNELSNKITKLLDNEDYRNELVKEGLEHVMNFDMKIMISKHVEFYRSLL